VQNWTKKFPEASFNPKIFEKKNFKKEEIWNRNLTQGKWYIVISNKRLASNDDKLIIKFKS
jgi:hypothetical protein